MAIFQGSTVFTSAPTPPVSKTITPPKEKPEIPEGFSRLGTPLGEFMPYDTLEVEQAKKIPPGFRRLGIRQIQEADVAGQVEQLRAEEQPDTTAVAESTQQPSPWIQDYFSQPREDIPEETRVLREMWPWNPRGEEEGLPLIMRAYLWQNAFKQGLAKAGSSSLLNFGAATMDELQKLSFGMTMEEFYRKNIDPEKDTPGIIGAYNRMLQTPGVMRQKAQDLERTWEYAFPTFGEQNTFMGSLAYGAGNFAAIGAATALGISTGFGSLGLLTGAAMMAGDEYNRALESGKASPEELSLIFIANLALGATDALPFGASIGALNKLTKNSLSFLPVRKAFEEGVQPGIRAMWEYGIRNGLALGKQAGAAGLRESIQETGQTAGQRITEYATYSREDFLADPLGFTEAALKEIGMAGLQGGILAASTFGLAEAVVNQLPTPQNSQDFYARHAVWRMAKQAAKGDPNLSNIKDQIGWTQAAYVELIDTDTPASKFMRESYEAAHGRSYWKALYDRGKELGVPEHYLDDLMTRGEQDSLTKLRSVIESNGYGSPEVDSVVENIEQTFKDVPEVMNKVEVLMSAARQGRTLPNIPLGPRTITGQIGSKTVPTVADLEKIQKRILEEQEQFYRQVEQENGANSPVTWLARRYIENYKLRGHINFTGIELNPDPAIRGQELAVLFQLSRDYQQEWANVAYFWTDPNTGSTYIIGHDRAGARQPTSARFNPSEQGRNVVGEPPLVDENGNVISGDKRSVYATEDVANRLLYYARQYQADVGKTINPDDVSFVLFHNHPTGEVHQSVPDVGATEGFYSRFGGRFLGHYVTNHGVYTFLDPHNKTYETHNLNLPYADPFLDPAMHKDIIGTHAPYLNTGMNRGNERAELVNRLKGLLQKGHELGNGTALIVVRSSGLKEGMSYERGARDYQPYNLGPFGGLLGGPIPQSLQFNVISGVQQIDYQNMSSAKIAAAVRSALRQGYKVDIIGIPNESDDAASNVKFQEAKELIDFNGFTADGSYSWVISNTATRAETPSGTKLVGEPNRAEIIRAVQGVPLEHIVPERGLPRLTPKFEGKNYSFPLNRPPAGAGPNGRWTLSFIDHDSTVKAETGPFAPPGGSDGLITFRIKDVTWLGGPEKAIKIDTVSPLPMKYRKQDIGSEMYYNVLEFARRNNLLLASDLSVTGDANTQWKNLENKGYRVRRNLSASPTQDGGWISGNGEPVYVLDPRGTTFSRRGMGRLFALLSDDSISEPIEDIRVGVTPAPQATGPAPVPNNPNPAFGIPLPRNGVLPNRGVGLTVAKFLNWIDPRTVLTKLITRGARRTQNMIAGELLELEMNSNSFVNLLRTELLGLKGHRTTAQFFSFGGSKAVPIEVWDAANAVLDGKLPTTPIDPAAAAQTARIQADIQAKIRDRRSIDISQPTVQWSDPRQVLSEAQINRLKNMRDQIDMLSRKLAGLGFISHQLRVKILNNLAGQPDHYGGTYIHRTYYKHLTKNWEKKVDPAVVQNARDFIRNVVKMPDPNDPTQTVPPTEGQIESIIDQILTNPDIERLLNQATIQGIPTGPLKTRQDIAKPIRELMGEVENPVARYYQTISHIAGIIHTATFFEQLATDLDGDVFFNGVSDPRIKPGYGQQIGSIGDLSLGALAEKTTHPLIAKAFRDIYNPIRTRSALITGLARMNAVAKYGKVIGSTMTQVRNFVSSGVMLFGAGILPRGKYARSGLNAWRKVAMDNAKVDPNFSMPPEWERGIKIAAGLDPNQALPPEIANSPIRVFELRLKRYAQLGLMGEGARAGELRRAAKYADVGKGDWWNWNLPWMMLPAKWRLGGKLNYLVSRPIDLYQGADVGARVTYFEAELNRYKETMLGRSMRPEELEVHVADIVNRTFQNYDLLPEVVKRVSAFPLFGTFVSFNAEYIRNKINMVLQAKAELRSPDLGIKNIGAQRLAGSMATLSLPPLASLAFNLMNGISWEEDKRRRRFLPDWDKRSNLLWFNRGIKGEYLNLDYYFPDAMFNQPIMMVARGGEEKALENQVILAFKEIWEPYVQKELFYKAIDEVMNNRDQYGNPLVNVKAPLGDQIAGKIAHLYTAVEPGVLTSGRRIVRAFQGEVTSGGRKLRPEFEIPAFAGLRISEMNAPLQLHYMGVDYVGGKKLAKDLYEQSVMSGNSLATNRKNLHRSVREYRREWERLRENYRAALYIGMPSWLARERLLGAGISKAEMEALEGTGVPPPLDFSTLQERALNRMRIRR